MNFFGGGTGGVCFEFRGLELAKQVLFHLENELSRSSSDATGF
jgi:hypothetical protein